MDHVVADAVADPEVSRAAEAVAGDQEQVLLPGLFGEGLCVPAGCFDEEVEGTVGPGHFVAHGGESLVEGSPVPVIGLQIRPEGGAAGDDPLHQAGSADVAHGSGGSGYGGVEGLPVCGGLGHIDVADPFAGKRQGLGVGVADEGIPVDAGDEGYLHPVGQLPIGLVGDQVDGVAIVFRFPGQQGGQLL